MGTSEAAQVLAQLGLGATWRSLGAALRRAVLCHDTTRPALRHPEPLLEPLNGYPAAARGHHFPSASSLSIALSNSASANSFLSRAFSTSRSLRRLASAALIPA